MRAPVSSKQPISRSLLLALSSLLLAACTTTGTGSISPAQTDSVWVQPTPQFRRKLLEQAERVPYIQRTEEMVEVIRFFVQARESAYDLLLGMAATSNSKVVGTALAALGETRDERLAPYVAALELRAEGGRQLQYERARCLVKLGDWAELPVLVSGLRDDELWYRALCAKALRDATHLSQGFDPDGDEEEREVAAQAWEAWLVARETDLY
jgi:HEAT repeat protein